MQRTGVVAFVYNLGVVLVLSLLLVMGAGSASMAKIVYDRSGLATCVPDANDPCADIVAPTGSVKPQNDASAGRLRIDQSPSASLGPSAGALPQESSAPSPLLSKPQAKSQAKSYVNTKIITKNNTQYSAYWRIGAVRNGKLWVWPSGSSYYTVKKYSSVTKVIRCIKGEVLGFGATSTNGMYYWGYSADFDQNCTSGCNAYCTGGTLTATMN